MQQPEPHPDELPNQAAIKKITRGGIQAIENKAIAEYMRAYEEVGRAEAEEVFFNHFNKSHGKQKQASIPTANS